METDRIDRKTVYVAGDAIYSPLGHTTQQNMDSIRQYRSGVAEISDESLFYQPFLGSRISDDDFDGTLSISDNENYTILEKRIIFSIKEAVANSNIPDTNEFFAESLLLLSTTKGNIDHLSVDETDSDKSVFLYEMAARVSAYFGIKGVPLVISNACISGVNSIITASRLIEKGLYKHMVIVGADLLSRFVVTGFQAFHSVSSGICLPYDVRRDGLSLGEAVGVLILTSQRDISKDKDPVVIEGGAVSNDANHLSAPSRTGDGLGNAILESMRKTGIKSSDIDFINAHGTATVYNDEMESKAFHWAGIQESPVQSLKPYWGHTLGASGVIESIACFWQLKNGILLATKGFKELGVPMKINVCDEHRHCNMRRCVKTASGFGGCNAAAIFALESYSGVKESVGESEWDLVDSFKLNGSQDFPTIIREYNKILDNKDLKFFKMDDLAKLGSTGASILLKRNLWVESVPAEKKGLFLANFSSSMDSDIKHQRAIDAEGDKMASPAVFVYTLPNIVLGEISIKNKFQGENTFFIFPKEMKDYSSEFLLGFARQTNLEVVIVGWCEHWGENFDLDLKLYKRGIYE